MKKKNKKTRKKEKMIIFRGKCMKNEKENSKKK